MHCDMEVGPNYTQRSPLMSMYRRTSCVWVYSYAQENWISDHFTVLCLVMLLTLTFKIPVKI